MFSFWSIFLFLSSFFLFWNRFLFWAACLFFWADLRLRSFFFRAVLFFFFEQVFKEICIRFFCFEQTYFWGLLFRSFWFHFSTLLGDCRLFSRYFYNNCACFFFLILLFWIINTIRCSPFLLIIIIYCEKKSLFRTHKKKCGMEWWTTKKIWRSSDFCAVFLVTSKEKSFNNNDGSFVAYKKKRKTN